MLRPTPSGVNGGAPAHMTHTGSEVKVGRRPSYSQKGASVLQCAGVEDMKALYTLQETWKDSEDSGLQALSERLVPRIRRADFPSKSKSTAGSRS